MKQYACHLINRSFVALDTIEVTLKVLEEYIFRAGQYADLALENPIYPDPEGETRTLSFLNRPLANNTIRFAMRISQSGFKQNILNCPIGSSLLISSPMGYFRFTSPQSQPIICIAGGIGITPFCSLVDQQATRQINHPIVLIYSNSDIKRAAYYEKFQKLSDHSDWFEFLPVFTHKNPRLRINEAFLCEHLMSLEKSQFYISGATIFVESIHTVLIQIGVPEYSIKSELFGDYTDW